MKEVIINNVKYTLNKIDDNSNLKIVILQRGWVMIGYLHKKENECTLTNAYVIRKWGTTNGLGQLALEGITSDTVLDKTGVAEFDWLTVIASISCDKDKWKNIFN